MESSAHSTFGTQTPDSAATGGVSNQGSPGANTDASAIAERAKNAASMAGDKLSDIGSAVRDKAGNLKETVADALESGAERLSHQNAAGARGAGAGAAADAISEDTRIAQASNQVAISLQGAADWLRGADLDGLTSGIERQVKDNPGRTLAVAVGVGYLLGKAFRK